MTLVPTGDPAWIRTADHTVYGGSVDKTNFQSQGVVNAQTDVGAEAFCRMASDLAAATRTAPFAVVTYLCNDSVPAAPTVTFVNQMTGIRSAQYAGNAAPTGFPSAARNGNGDVTITWGTTYDDPYGVAGAVNIVHCEVSGVGTTAIIATYDITSANVVRVRLFDAAGAAVSDKRATLSVWTG